MTGPMTRRELLTWGAAGVVAAAVALPGCARAPQAGLCPGLGGRRIRWIVPNAPGGGYDTESRLLQPFLEATLGAEILIVNHAGAGGRLGARAIADAPPDGLTIGIAGMPGLLIASMLGEPGALDPARAFTMLGRVSRSSHVWAASADSPLRSVDDVVRAAAQRPLIFAINEVGSANVVSITVAATLLGVQATLVPGFEGMRAATLAAVRGDVDLVSFNFETIRPLIEGGELRPLLQISSKPITSDPTLGSVPVIGGLDGVAAQRARWSGADAQQAVRVATALDRVVGSGRVVVAPRGLSRVLTVCFSRAIQGALTSEVLRTRAGRSFDPADAARAQADADAAAEDALLLRPILERALARLRG